MVPGFGREVNLDVIGVTVKVEVMAMANLTVEEEVDDEPEGTKDRASEQGVNRGEVVIDTMNCLRSERFDVSGSLIMWIKDLRS